MFRLRVCYGKIGRLRFLGHLEVCGALERAVRRARLPVAYGQGFHPKARLAFGPALPVGTAGDREYVDVYLTDHVPAVAATEALVSASPEGLPIRSAKYVATNAASVAAAVVAAAYEVGFVGLSEGDTAAMERGIEALSRQDAIEVTKRERTRTYALEEALIRRPRLATDRPTPTLELWLALSDQAPMPPEAVAGVVSSEIDSEHFLRIARMECYAREGDGRDGFVSLSGVET